jgi:hypothetical protein
MKDHQNKRYAAILAQGAKLTQPRFLVNIIDDDGNECLRWLTAAPRKGEYIAEEWWRKGKRESDGGYQVVGVHHCPAGDWISQPHVVVDVMWRSANEKFDDTFGSHMKDWDEKKEQETKLYDFIRSLLGARV